MPYIITGAIADLQKKGMDIGLAGQGRAISVFMRPMEYEEFFVRFHRVGAAVSQRPACVAKYEAMELPELEQPKVRGGLDVVPQVQDQGDGRDPGGGPAPRDQVDRNDSTQLLSDFAPFEPI